MNERYTYQIFPRRPIKNLIPKKGIRKPCALQLTKEEVKICMASGPVYRCIPGKAPVRVTGSNLDELHKSSFSSNSKINKNKDTNNGDKIDLSNSNDAEASKLDEVTINDKNELHQLRFNNVQTEVFDLYALPVKEEFSDDIISDDDIKEKVDEEVKEQEIKMQAELVKEEFSDGITSDDIKEKVIVNEPEFTINYTNDTIVNENIEKEAEIDNSKLHELDEDDNIEDDESIDEENDYFAPQTPGQPNNYRKKKKHKH